MLRTMTVYIVAGVRPVSDFLRFVEICLEQFAEFEHVLLGDVFVGYATGEEGEEDFR